MYKPEDYKLIATLWFLIIENKECTGNYVSKITEPKTTSLNTISSLYSSPYDVLGFAPLGNNFNISFNGARISADKPNSAIKKASVNNSFTVNVPNGSFNASSLYYDNLTNFINVNEQEVFTVNSGHGIFEDAKIALIKYDNTGKIFGYPFSRRIEIYKLKKKHLLDDKEDDKTSCKVECPCDEESNHEEEESHLEEESNHEKESNHEEESNHEKKK
jgi:hypothetical protein